MDQQISPKPSPQVQPISKKHIGTFWPIVIIMVVCAVVAGVIVWVSYNDSISDDLSAMVLKVHLSKSSDSQEPVSKPAPYR